MTKSKQEFLEKIKDLTGEEILNLVLNDLNCSNGFKSDNHFSIMYFHCSPGNFRYYFFPIKYNSKINSYFNFYKDYKNVRCSILYCDIEKYRKEHKEEIEKAEKEFIEECKKLILLKKDEIIKLIEKRKKDIFRLKKVTEKNKTKKQNLMENMSKTLLGLGYNVSKVCYKADYNSYNVYNRSIPDKYHKYIEVEKNIKFATIEVKINNDSYSIGVKFETRGQIGCTYDDFILAINKIKEEYEILKSKIEVKE